MKRIIAYIIVLCLSISLLNMPVYADEAEIIDEGLYFNDFNGKENITALSPTIGTRTKMEAVTEADGVTAVKVYIPEGDDKTGYSYLTLPVIENKDEIKPDVAYEIRMKLRTNTSGFVTTDYNTHSFIVSGNNLKYSLYKPENALAALGTIAYDEWSYSGRTCRQMRAFKRLYFSGRT